MTLVSKSIKVKGPDYFHRDYKNDLKIDDPKKAPEPENLGLRVAKAALPFIALYKPAGTALSVVMGGCRAISNASQTCHAYSEGKGRLKIAGELLHTTVAVVSVGCAFFALPLGMLVTTCHDLAMNCIQLHQAWHEKDPAKAREAGLQILCNAVYLGLFFTASLQILVASIALQILVGLYQTSGEFQKGNYLEVGTGLLMVAVRMNQMAKPVSMLQAQWKAEALTKKASTLRAIEENCTAKAEITGGSLANTEKKPGQISPAALDVILKYGSNPKGISPLHYAIEKRDFLSAEILIKEGMFLEVTDWVETSEGKLRRYVTPAMALLFMTIDSKDSELTKNCDKLLKLCFEKINLNFSFELSTQVSIPSHARSKRGGWNGTGTQHITNQAQYLIRELNNRVYNQWVLITESTKKEHLNMIDILLKRGADINGMQHLLNPCLSFGDIEGVKFFIERGYEIRDRDCLDPLTGHIVMHKPNSFAIMEIIKFLESKGLNLNKTSVSDPNKSQLDVFLKQIISLPSVTQQLKQDLIPFLISLGAKI